MTRRWKTFVTVIFMFTAAGALFGATVSHELLTEILQDHVEDGLVDYRSLKEDPRLDTYIETISRVDPETLESREAEMAFYINAYNAYTLKILSGNYPLESITDLNDGGLVTSTLFKKTIWDKKLVKIDGKRTTLNAIEHDILRPVYNDFRIHFAIVCGALSCPPLRNEAFTAEKLDSQLDEQGRIFFDNRKLNSFDRDKKKANLTKIMQWFKDDFGKNDRERLIAITPFLDSSLATDIKSNAGAWKIRFNDYDWALNEQ